MSLLIGMLLCKMSLYAQLKAVVANMETKVPVRNALIYSIPQNDTLSCWDGTFCLKDSFERFTISHPHFITRVVNAGEFHNGDTILLIPKEGYIGEVEVWGKRKNKNAQFQLDKVDAQLLAARNKGGNLLGLLELIGKAFTREHESKKHKLKRILDDY